MCYQQFNNNDFIQNNNKRIDNINVILWLSNMKELLKLLKIDNINVILWLSNCLPMVIISIIDNINVILWLLKWLSNKYRINRYYKQK